MVGQNRFRQIHPIILQCKPQHALVGFFGEHLVGFRQSQQVFPPLGIAQGIEYHCQNSPSITGVQKLIDGSFIVRQIFSLFGQGLVIPL